MKAIVLITLLGFPLSAHFLAAQPSSQKVNVKGFVKDAASGETLPYANITLVGTDYGTSTNTDGYFVLVNIPAGPCTLRVSYIGYKQAVVPLNGEPNAAPVIIEMEQQSLELEGVTVTAENLQTLELADHVSEIRISPRQLKTLPSVGEVDIFRSLQLLPGISAVNDGSSGLYIRGGTPDQNLVLFDGMTIYNVDHFFGFISAFNTEAVKDVRVFKGGFPAKFGGRTSGVIELTGKTGSFDNFHAGGNVNLLSGSGVVQVPISERGAWLVSFRRSHTDLIQSGLYNSIFNSISGQNSTSDETEEQTTSGPAFRPGRRAGGPFAAQTESVVPSFYYYDLNSKLTYSVSPNDMLSISFYNGEDNLDESQDLGTLNFRGGNIAGTDSVANALINDVTEWGNLGVSGKWSRVWSDRIYSNFLLAYSNYFSRSQSSFSTRGGAENTIQRAFNSAEDNEIRDFTLRFDTEWQMMKSHKIEFGALHSRTEVDLLFTANDSVSILDRNDEAVQTSLYLQDTWRLFRPLQLTFGLRTTNYGPTNQNYYEPRASFQLDLPGNLALKGAWGKYNQFISRITNEDVLEGNRDFWLLADNELDPASAEHRIAGLSYETPHLLFDIEAYHKDLDGVAEFSQRFRRGPNTVSEDLFFLGTGVAKGIEFLAQKKSGKLNGWASYTLGTVDYQFEVFNDGETFPAVQDRTHEVKLVGSYALGSWNLSSTWVYASGAPYTAPENQYSIELIDGSSRSYIHVGDKNANRLPAYHRLDISFSRQFHAERFAWDFGISVFNLYNHSNVWYRQYVLDTSPIIVRDITTLGITPTLTLGIRLK